MIPRLALPTLHRLAAGFPIIALTGPRQSGKTTLARIAFPAKPYISLEDPDEREFAERDPRGFLARFPEGAIFDEAQRCPALFSYLQAIVDEHRQVGQFILTGSQQFGLMSGITQSLAGRVGMVQLLPLSLAELQTASLAPASLDTLLWQGTYPALYDRSLAPGDWFAAYVTTYLERDVRQLLAVRDLSQFQRFVRMCAARSGQLLNLSALASDCGISHVTAREWLSVLETSYLVTLLRPYHRNFGKRLTKSPKLYFLDVGLMAYLLGIRDPDSLATHAQRGALFETWVVSEAVKQSFNAGRLADLHFWRDGSGNEVDLLHETPAGLQASEIKSGATFAADWPNAAQRFARLAETPLPPWIIYGGKQSYTRENCRVIAWQELPQQEFS